MSIPKAAPVHGLHHAAYRCRDAEETRHFYEDILGLPLSHIVAADIVPSTGAKDPYVHLFFRMTDGSCIAFFDLGDGVAAAPSPNTPAWVNHIAFKVDDLKALDAMKQRLVANNISVIGPTDHGFVQSIYFFDPNGVRLEFTTQTVGNDEIARYESEAHDALREWTQFKRRKTAHAHA